MRARLTSNESIRAQDSLVHVYAFILISRTIHRKTHKTNGHTFEEDNVRSYFFFREKVNENGREMLGKDES